MQKRTLVFQESFFIALYSASEEVKGNRIKTGISFAENRVRTKDGCRNRYRYRLEHCCRLSDQCRLGHCCRLRHYCHLSDQYRSGHPCRFVEAADLLVLDPDRTDTRESELLSAPELLLESELLSESELPLVPV